MSNGWSGQSGGWITIRNKAGEIGAGGRGCAVPARLTSCDNKNVTAPYLSIVARSVSVRYFRCAVISCSIDTPGGRST